jgi:hypothetical protein
LTGYALRNQFCFRSKTPIHRLLPKNFVLGLCRTRRRRLCWGWSRRRTEDWADSATTSTRAGADCQDQSAAAEEQALAARQALTDSFFRTIGVSSQGISRDEREALWELAQLGRATVSEIVANVIRAQRERLGEPGNGNGNGNDQGVSE